MTIAQAIALAEITGDAVIITAEGADVISQEHAGFIINALETTN